MKSVHFIFPPVEDGKREQTGDQTQKARRDKSRQMKWRYVNSKGKERERKREIKRNGFVKIPFHLTRCLRKVQLRPAHHFLQLHGAPPSLIFFLCLSRSLPLLTFFPSLIPKDGVTGVYFTSDPFMNAAILHSCRTVCLKRLSDRAMNTLSGFSLPVSLCLAGQ